jgi:hypothetical protein
MTIEEAKIMGIGRNEPECELAMKKRIRKVIVKGIPGYMPDVPLS